MISNFFRDLDTVDGIQLMRVALYFGVPCFVLLSLLWIGLALKAAIAPWVLLVLLAVNLPVTALGVIFVYQSVTVAAKGLGNALTAAGNIPPPPSYPQQDLLIARGEYREAAEYFKDHIRVTPDDLEARLRLADLLERHLKDFAEVERLYLEVRRSRPSPHQEISASNGLIDLYRKTGRVDRLKVELARFADRYPGTPHAAAARKELRDLKGEEPAQR